MPEFGGFQPQDFDSLDGSTWRKRGALGGVLAAALRSQLGRPYQSWGVRRCLELHLAHETHYAFDDPWPCAKLFVYSHHELAFGLFIETPEATSERIEHFVHWRNFRDRLQTDPAMQTALLSAMANHDLVMTDYYQQDTGGALECQFRFLGDHLHRRQPGDSTWKAVPVKSLFRRLAQLPEDQWVDLRVFATIEEQVAIDMESDVVGPILTVLRALAPVYEMTVAK